MKMILKGFIRLYIYLISPLSGPSCRFHPTCSAYALEAIESHGSIKGAILTIRRLMKCHPWYRGANLDPVPGVDKVDMIRYKRASNHITHRS